jgi:glycosyltransferase involved in cell wall biosynthesis
MTLLDKTNTLVIVPAYNEQDSIVSVIEEIKATGFSFVVIDDGSTDETRNRAIAAGARTISLPFNAGVGAALKCGFKIAIASECCAVIQCDADGQHPTKYFNELVRKANKEDFDYVVVSRYAKPEKRMHYRYFAHKILTILISKKSGRLTDTTSGLRLIREPLLEVLAENMPDYFLGDTFETVYAVQKASYRITEIDGSLRDRSNGRPSENLFGSIAWTLRCLIVVALGTHLRIPRNTDSSQPNEH